MPTKDHSYQITPLDQQSGEGFRKWRRDLRALCTTDESGYSPADRMALVPTWGVQEDQQYHLQVVLEALVQQLAQS